MIFDTIIYGTFTADDFINAHTTNDFTKFTPLPIDIRKKFISDVIDLYPNKESNNFKQAAFDFIDGKITEKQFRDAWREYWWDSSLAVAVAVAAVVAAVVAVEYFHPYAKHLNKVIQENE